MATLTTVDFYHAINGGLSNQQVATWFTVPSGRYVRSIRFMPNITMGNYTARLWTAGGTLLGTTNTIQPPNGSEWYTLNLATPVWISAGTEYVITVYGTGVGFLYSDHGGSPGQQHNHGDTTWVAVGKDGNTAGSALPSKETFSNLDYIMGVVFATNDPPTNPGTPSITPNPVNTNGTVTFAASTDPEGGAVTYYVDLSTNNGSTWTRIINGANPAGSVYDFSAQPATTTARLRVLAADSLGTDSAWVVGPTFTIQHNVAPTAPTPTSPPNNSTVDRNLVQRLAATFNDPDAGDSSTKFDLRWRLGAGAWNDVTQTTPNRYWDAPAGTFPAGQIGWQIRYYDSQGVVGPYSAEAFFAAANPPATPSITSPVNNATQPSSSGLVAWSAPSQDSFQVRKVADNAGAPDTATVYYDSGEVASSTARDHALAFPTNNRFEHIQVRVKVGGLWSTWASVRVSVSYTPPAAGTVAVTTESPNGRVTLSVTPGSVVAGQPAITHSDIYRMDPRSGISVRVVKNLPPGTTFYDYEAGSGVAYEYYATSFGANGTSSTGPSTVMTPLALRGIWLHDPEAASATVHRFPWDGHGRTVTRTTEAYLIPYVGRRHPVAEYGDAETLTISVDLPLDAEEGDLDALETLRLRKAILLYRDGRGRRMFGHVSRFPMTDTVYGARMPLEMQAVDYTEGV